MRTECLHHERRCVAVSEPTTSAVISTLSLLSAASLSITLRVRPNVTPQPSVLNFATGYLIPLPLPSAPVLVQPRAVYPGRRGVGTPNRGRMTNVVTDRT